MSESTMLTLLTTTPVSIPTRRVVVEGVELLLLRTRKVEGMVCARFAFCDEQGQAVGDMSFMLPIPTAAMFEEPTGELMSIALDLLFEISKPNERVAELNLRLLKHIAAVAQRAAEKGRIQIEAALGYPVGFGGKGGEA